MVSFHERVAALQDGRVGQGSGRANFHLDRKFGLDVLPVGLLCYLVEMGLASAFGGVVSQSTDGTARSPLIVEQGLSCT